MSDFDGEAGAVNNKAGEQYSAMPMSFQARMNKEQNAGMGYNNLSDLANTPPAPTQMEGAKNNRQVSPQMPGEDEFNYNANR